MESSSSVSTSLLSGDANILIKQGTTIILTLTFDEKDAMIVSELKDLIEQKTEIPSMDQRLVYAGRVLGDDHVINVTNTKGTIYLTRKPSNFNSSVPASSASSNIETSSNMGKMKNSLQSPSPSIISSSKMSFLEGERDNVNGKDKEINDSNIPLNSNFSPFSLTNSSTMQSGATGNGSGTNPFISSQMKLMQSMIENNPEMMQKMLQSHPKLKQMMEKNPQIKHALSDPKTIKEIFEMSTNPTAYKEMMRNYDRTLSHLESIPEGYQYLRQIYTTENELADKGISGANISSGGITNSEPSKEQTMDPIPNPWKSKSPPPISTSSNSSSSQFNFNPFISNPSTLNFSFPPPSSTEGISLDDIDFENIRLDNRSSLFESHLSTSLPDNLPDRPDNPISHQVDNESGLFDITVYESRFKMQLEKMDEMGFTDKKKNIRALLATGGNLNSAIERLLTQL